MLYTYKGNTYTVTGTGMMKNPVTRKWENAIIYKSMIDDQVSIRESKEFITLFKQKEKIPYHIQVIAKVYPILRTEHNMAKGEIRKFQFIESQRGKHLIGKRVVSMERTLNKDYDSIWVHVGNDYFKMIGLWPSIIS